MAECNTCGGYLSIEDKIRLSMKCDANGNVVWQGSLLNYSDEAKALFERMTVQPNSARKRDINTVIESLKSEGLWAKLDALWVTKAHDVDAAKLNWIKNAHNLTKGGEGTLTFTQDVGFNSDGTTYLDTNYNPSTQAVKFTLNNATFEVKKSGTIAATELDGASSGTSRILLGNYASKGVNRLNSNIAASQPVEAGYNSITRVTADVIQFYQDRDMFYDSPRYETTAAVSTGLPNHNLYLLAANENGIASYFGTGKLEFALVGGYLTTDELTILRDIFEDYFYGSSFIVANQFNKGKVLFTFDDYFANQYALAFPLFNSYGVKGTLFPPINTLTGMWAQLLEMYNAGWSVANHTNAHVPFNTLSDAQIISEITTSQAAFVSNGIPAPQTMCTPGNIWTAGQKAIVDSYFPVYRGYDTGAQLFHIYANTDKHYLPSVGIDNQRTFTTDKAKRLIKECVRRKTALIFTAHNVFNNTGVSGGIDLSKLSALIEYSQSLNADIITIDSLVSEMS